MNTTERWRAAMGAGRTLLAPMAGVADAAFRVLCREQGAGATVSEMCSAKGLLQGDRKSRSLLACSAAERPFGIQLFGDEPETLARAVEVALTFAPDFLDLNAGCPAPKVVNNGGGSALLRDPALLGRILEAMVRAAGDVPVTVKIRKGWDAAHINALEVARVAEQAGVAALTMHGRTREQMYAPSCDWESIAQVRAAVSIPVVANGDVFTPQDAVAIRAATGCDYVMIGRGALGRPYLFGQAEAALAGRAVPPAPDVPARMALMLRHIALLCERKGERGGMLEARKHAGWYMKGLRGAAALRREAGELTSFTQLETLAARVAAQCTAEEGGGPPRVGNFA